MLRTAHAVGVVAILIGSEIATAERRRECGGIQDRIVLRVEWSADSIATVANEADLKMAGRAIDDRMALVPAQREVRVKTATIVGLSWRGACDGPTEHVVLKQACAVRVASADSARRVLPVECHVAQAAVRGEAASAVRHPNGQALIVSPVSYAS